MNRFYQFVVAFFLCSSLLVAVDSAHSRELSAQTNVDQAAHSVDAAGVPTLSIDGVGAVAHPAWTALYALAYAGIEDYDPSLGLKPDAVRFQATIDWLKNNLVQDSNGLWVWVYNFDSTYNDVSIKAPWSSAFAQAVGIQALLAHWKQTGDEQSLEFARKAAQALFVPLEQGGFLFRSGDDIWFEEIPEPVNNPSHILNGHMRTLLALGELADATGDEQYRQWFSRGSDTLMRWLPLYDAGYWLRYDLNPRKEELLFRLANPYGFANPELAIDRIVLRDPLTGEESVLDIGGPSDAEGAVRIAGNDWGQIEQLEGRSIRRLRPVEGAREAVGSEGQMVAPYSYFYLKLPGQWQDNLRKAPYELSVEYYDDKPANLEVQMRSIAPGSETFKKLKDSDLLISGKGAWRQWKINLYPSDLGYWVGELYAGKHAVYLDKLSISENRKLLPWSDAARAYMHAIGSGENYALSSQVAVELPSQTPMLPIYSLDERGVLMQHMASSATKFDNKGMYDPGSDAGVPVYSPYIIASQLIDGPNTPGAAYSKISMSEVGRSPALAWFMDKGNQVDLGAAVTYEFPFLNVYNDVVTKPSWPSAFSQAYILRALSYVIDNIDEGVGVQSLLVRSAYAYGVSVHEGGISSRDKSGDWFFEEVPNGTHVLNAHLISVPELSQVAGRLKDSNVDALVVSGLQALKSHLSKFDTGYWLRYDLNPKKELLFQLDWLSGDASPLIEDISLEAPQFAKRNRLYVGGEQAFEGATRISGLEWQSVQQVDGRQVRAFANGYLAHAEPVQGGTRHNAYAVMQLPESNFADYFDVQPHRLVIRYKDVAAGKFAVKLQSINEGNVLDFTPLRNSVITMSGDQQWKEAVIEVRPQDMGWYKGADYQVFEVDQLERIAKLTGDWFFAQYAERQRYYLDAKSKGQSVIIQPVAEEGVLPVALTVLNSSSTYEGFGFENALDGDPNDDYVAGLEGEAEEYVELAMDRPLNHVLLGFSWESDRNHPKEVRIFSLGINGERKLLLSKFVESGVDLEFRLEAQQSFQSLRIVFVDPVGQPRVLLRMISLFEVGSRHSHVSYGGVGGKDFLSATDKKNPLHVFNKAISMRVAELSHQLSRAAGDDEEKIVSFMRYLGEMKVGFPEGSTLDDIISGQVGHCGSFSELLVALAAVQGVQGRVYYLYDWPKGSRHVLAELKISGTWRLYDPSYGATYHEGDKNGRQLSFDEVVQRYSSAQPVGIKILTTRPGVKDYVGEDLFLRSNPMQLVSVDKPFMFSFELELGRDEADTLLRKGAPGFARLLGGELIGAGYINQQQVWSLKGLVPGKRYRFRVGVGSVQGGGFELISRLVNGEEITRKDTVQSLGNIEYVFEARSNEVALYLEHPYRDAERRYLTVESYEFGVVGEGA